MGQNIAITNYGDIKSFFSTFSNKPMARRRMAANEVVFIVRALRSAVKGGATMLLGMSPMMCGAGAAVGRRPAVHSSLMIGVEW